MDKIYRACLKRADGYIGRQRFDTKEEAMKCLSYWQSEARFELKHKKCKPIPAGMFSVSIDYDDKFQIVEVWLEETEKPVWNEVSRYTLDDWIPV